MAQQYIDSTGVYTLPNAYVSIAVAANPSGLATSGVLMLVGEADAGPDFTLEPDVALNFFGPDQMAAVTAKYKSGPLVLAMQAAVQPANDPDITGAPSSFVLIKTNPSGKASGTLPKIGGGVYTTISDKSYGALGNLSSFNVKSLVAEVVPTTGPFTYIPPVGQANVTIRVNGGAELALAITANMQPPALQAAVAALAGGGVNGTGGVNRNILAVAGTLALAATGAIVTITRSVAWAVTPTAGDTLVIPTGSVIAGAGNANVGAFVVTSANATQIIATKLSDAGKGGAVVGTVTAPVAVSAATIVALTDLQAFSPITISMVAGNVIDGLSKNLEINELTTGADTLTHTAWVLATTTPVTWISKTLFPQQLVSAAEYQVQVNTARQVDAVQEQFSAGGPVALKIGYTGTSCSVVVGPTSIVLTPVGGVAGGTVTTLSLTPTSYPTLADLAAYINALPGFNAAVGTTSLGQQSPLALDEGTFTCGTTWGNSTLRLKMDAVSFFNKVATNSILIGMALPAIAGLPDVQTTMYLSGGSRGGTTDAIFNAAIDSLQGVQGNFLVPLFSRNASLDIASGLTDSSSTYTLANVNAYTKTHVLTMSTIKKARNRQAFLSIRDTFVNDQAAAQNLAAPRCSLAMQDVKVAGSNGVIQAQPHIMAALAAGMQAAAFYKGLVNKNINCSGILQAAGDYKDTLDSNEETALLAGLLVAKKDDGGGFVWVSDQTTYSKDNNFLYNSIQAIYVSDIIALTIKKRMNQAFVGQSIADISAGLGLAAMEHIMADLLRLKLIAVSDDAPKGFKNLVIKINGTAMLVNCEVKLAGLIYFVPISLLVSQVTQSANS